MKQPSRRICSERCRRSSANPIIPGLLLLAVLSACTVAVQTPPADAVDACPLSAATFASWFESGTVTLNGVVNPANSLTVLSPNCGFYEWSEQMFLWLNSPTPPAYGGGGGRIFDSPAFFDVSPIQPDGHRIFIPHQIGVVRNLNLRAAQRGALGLPVIMDRERHMFSVVDPPANAEARPMVRNLSGELVEIAHARRGDKSELVLVDPAGQIIQPAPARVPDLSDMNAEQVSRALTARKFVVDGITFFLGPSSGLIDVEQGQAGGGDVLEAQNGSLIYYLTSVNDVFAYFATGAKNGGITPMPTEFPTTMGALNQVTTFAAAHGTTFPDPEALAVEIKSAWIEAAGLPNLSSYITRTATIPTYDTSNPNQWVPNGQKTTKLALVAMHVVGSTAQHPEMVWATFAHIGITPNAQFTYNSTSGAKTVAQNTNGTWLFSASGASGPFNEAHMKQPFGTLDIVPISPHTISPSNTLRVMPWGMPGSNAASNTEVISMNNNVRGMLAGGDVRGNYVMIGATWTIPGIAPPQGQVGTNRLANTTMETYQQGGNCFSCHFTSTTSVSHVYPDLEPLFP